MLRLFVVALLALPIGTSIALAEDMSHRRSKAAYAAGRHR